MSNAYTVKKISQYATVKISLTLWLNIKIKFSIYKTLTVKLKKGQDEKIMFCSQR